MTTGTVPSAHLDRFALDHLPPADQWPEMPADRPPLAGLPPRLNAAGMLLGRAMAGGHGRRPAILFEDTVWSYADLLDRADRIARVLVEDLGLVPGNRVLLHSPNTPMMVAAWFAVLKAGGVCVATMPLLRAREIGFICGKAEVALALTDHRLAAEVEGAMAAEPHLKRVVRFSALGDGAEPTAELDRAMAGKAGGFADVDTAATDVAIIAFTSGTTGPAKGTMHFHRDLIAACECFPRLLGIRPDDRFCGTPPVAFTFGLGAHVLFPFHHGASVVLRESFTPEALLDAVGRYRVTGLYTAPTAYRAMADLAGRYDLSSLRMCVSAGEHLPRATWDRWHAATGIRIVDGIGATEMLHIFIAAAGDDIRPGSTGRAIHGYEARIVDDEGHPLPPGSLGRLAVRGATGCRYLDNPERQRAYVKDGWNLTGDVYRMDEDGYFWYQARSDDMIVSAGYNISGPEVENILMEHPDVAECAVVGVPDEERGQVVKAFVVLKVPADASETKVKEFQDFVKSRIAPYKYPRQVEFRTSLPRTPTGKLQRFALKT
jgi:2-aminobenzoate-CoA ligase